MMNASIHIDRAALLLVDLQRDLLHEDGALVRAGFSAVNRDEAAQLVDACRELAASVRRAGRPVVWVTTEFRADFADSAMAQPRLDRMRAAGTFLTQGTWGAGLMDGLAPEPSDHVVVKKGHGAFPNTHLDRLLSNFGVSQCIVAGGGMEDSIAETARTGGILGYEQFFVEDASYPRASAGIREVSKHGSVVSVADVASAASATSEPAPAGPGYAMVLIDMQNDFMNAERPSVVYGSSTPMPEEKRQRILNNTQRLTTAVRANGWPVIYVHVGRREDNLDDAHSPVGKETRSLPPGVTHCALGTWGAQIVDEISPLDDDFMVRKTGGSGFGFTPLHRILRNLNVRNLLMTGGAVTGCVWATALDGVTLGYDVTVVGDATYPPDSADLETLGQWCAVRATDDVLPALASTRTA